MKFDDYKKADVADKLKFWIELPKGSLLGTDWPDMNEWDKHIRDVCSEALLEIQFLRKTCGAVSRGPDLNDIKKNLPNR